MNSRKYPRTMREAFGPYTSYEIHEPKSIHDRKDTIIYVGCAVAFLAFLAIQVFA